VGLAVRKQKVDEHSDNREQEHDQAPQQLVHGRAVRFQDLDCFDCVSDPVTNTSDHILSVSFSFIVQGRYPWELTEDQHIEDQHNQADYPTACAVADGIALNVEFVAGERSSEGEGRKEDLEEE
jgi:hypothetical protein